VGGRVDALFCGFVLASSWFGFPGVVRFFAIPLAVMYGLQAFSMALDLWKYRRFSSCHAYSSKAAGIAQFVAVVGLFGFGELRLLWLAITMGVLSHVERIAITLTRAVWTHDVRSILDR